MALSNSANIPDLKGNKEELAFGVIQAEIREMRKLMEYNLHERVRPSRRGSISAIEFERITNQLEKLQNSKRIPMPERMELFHILIRETEMLMSNCEEKSDHFHFRNMMERIHRAMNESH